MPGVDKVSASLVPRVDLLNHRICYEFYEGIVRLTRWGLDIVRRSGSWRTKVPQAGIVFCNAVERVLTGCAGNPSN